jgi:hypothetical protein
VYAVIWRRLSAGTGHAVGEILGIPCRGLRVENGYVQVVARERRGSIGRWLFLGSECALNDCVFNAELVVE